MRRQAADGTGMDLDLAARSPKPQCLAAQARPSHLIHFAAKAPAPSFYTADYLEPTHHTVEGFLLESVQCE